MNSAPMNPIPDYILDTILPEILEGNAGNEQMEIWNAWLNESPAHAQWYNEMKQIWDTASTIESPVSADASWALLIEKRQVLKPVFFRRYFKGLSAAAAVLVVMGLGYWFLMLRNANDLKEYAFTKQDQLSLPDSSRVFSPGDAVIEYAGQFGRLTREVRQRKGTAFYEVKKNPDKPFIIHTGIADVKVLGTSFTTSVNADSVEVIVATGRVKVYRDMDSVILVPGEKVVYYMNKTHTQKMINQDQNFIFWKTGVLEYQDVLLADVLNDLQSKLHCEINYSAVSDLSQRRLSGRYRVSAVDQILAAIAETLDLKVSKNQHIFILEEKQ